MNKYILLILFALSSAVVSAQLVKHDRLLSFEDDDILRSIKTTDSEVAISEDHYKDGTRSLLWEYTSSGQISINKELRYEPIDPTGKDTYLSTFVVWIYNSTPTNKSIRFEFLKNGRVCTTFPFNINFRGWRAAWVCYDRDMQGKPEEGMNEVRIIAPDVAGRLYIDHLITSVKADHRYQSPDVQVPFVNEETNNHWLQLLNVSHLTPDIGQEPLTDQQTEDLNMMDKRFADLLYIPSTLTQKNLESIRKEYDIYQIKTDENGNISGLPLFYTRAVEVYERLIPDWKNKFEDNNMEFRKYFTLMNRIAIAYRNATNTEQKDELENMFVNMFDHAQDQGVAYGSCLGNITHYGYSFRNFFTAYYLMKDVLIKTNRFHDADMALRWYAMTNEVFVKPEEPGMDMDAFNTIATGRFCSIMLMENSPEKVQYMRSFSRWIDNGCLPAKGLNDAFKADGSAYHHCNNYPAYAVGGLSGATDMIYLMSRTSFAVSELAHQTVKNVLLSMRFYCNKLHFPLSMSGRHPNGKGTLIPTHYGRMALAGSPDGISAVDEDMASAFLRLKKGDDDINARPEYSLAKNSREDKILTDALTKSGYNAEAAPTGNMSMPYACLAVQRRADWSAVVRGHSRYLWAAEHYIGANRYGRYLAHGSMQIMTALANATVTPETSGWVENGFDWTRIPGATAIHLPIDELEANILNVDKFSGFEEMLYSDEAFAGGISQQSINGAFGMKLHEHDKYNGSLRARKSYHFFDNVIVCLGSDIENINEKYDTETTIFQLAATTDSVRNYWDNYRNNKGWWIDHIGTGYYIPTKRLDQVKFEKNYPQYSRLQNTGSETSANWVSLVYNHKKAPKNESYEYAVIPHIDEAGISAFSKKPTYRVLQHNSDAHIVKDLKSNAISYVLFETPDKLPKGIVQKVDTSCLVMVKENKKDIVLTVANPDLALYRGSSDDIFDQEGKRIERSIYSRPWISNESKEIPVTITLEGEWIITKRNDACKLISSNKKSTVLLFTCKDGRSYDIALQIK